MAWLGVPATRAASSPRHALVVCGSPDNDLVRALQASGLDCPRFGQPEEAVSAAAEGTGVLLLGEGYPERTTELPGWLLAQAEAKGLRLYVEFPATLPGMEVGRPRGLEWGRGVVASDAFGPDLKRLRLLTLHDCQFVPVSAPSAQLVLGRVAGFDTAVFDLPKPAFPLLFEHGQGHLLVATTKLSQFVTARYAPTAAWTAIWMRILRWLDPSLPVSSLRWTPTVSPSYGRDEPLPSECERAALKRGVAWLKEARLLVPAARAAELQQRAGSGIAPQPPPASPIGDGSLGILEGITSRIQPDGRQWQSIALRSDCHAESAMALAFGAKAIGPDSDARLARNLLDFLYFTSDARKREYADPDNGAYGLIAWGMNSEAWRVATYGDDEARVLLGTMAAAAVLQENRWDQPMLQCLLADLRTTGRLGFREDRIDLGPLRTFGWQHYFNRRNVNFAPHYQAYLWACYLWAWRQTGFTLFRERAETALRLTMEAYPGRWRWTNGMQQERARMLLPLAWLVRVDDTPEHRQWLRRMAEELLARQDQCGALCEEIGPLDQGQCRPPQSNAEYGTAEAPLLQENGDPVCDLLYTSNFAFLGLNEAAAATGDPFYARAADRLARFLCRIQVKSTAHPELNGGWFRAFDFKRWEYWASSSDAGWGAWSIETGWTQTWLCSVLALRQLRTSLWELTAGSRIQEHFARWRPVMLPDDALAPPLTSDIEHAGRGKPHEIIVNPKDKSQ